jgi:hypothetical protein
MRYLPGAHWNPRSWWKVSVDLTRLDYPEDLLVMWFFTEEVDTLRKHFKGKFAQLRRASTKTLLRELLRENLILHPSIRDRINQFKGEWFNGKMVGVHVRYTDRRGRLRLIRKRLDALLEREPHVRIFLATDNLQIQNLFQEQYPSVITTEKWYPTSAASIHRNPECRDRMENGIAALIDMYLLAECDYLILDESSAFSYVVSLVTSQPSSNIFNVQRGWWLPPRVRRLIWMQMLRVRRLALN